MGSWVPSCRYVWVAHTKGVMTSLSLHRRGILRKSGKSKMWFLGEKKLKLLCTYFSVGRYSTECCYYSLYTLFEGGGWTTWNTQKMISQWSWLSKAATQYVHDSKIGVQQIKGSCFLSKHPMQVSVLYIWPFLPSTNRAKCPQYSSHCLALQREMSMAEQTVIWFVYLIKLSDLSMLPLTCGTVFLKPSLFLKQLPSSHSHLFISAGAEKLWPRAASHLSK